MFAGGGDQVALFQFLIGRLVTAQGDQVAGERLEFQFLIGRLVTRQDMFILSDN